MTQDSVLPTGWGGEAGCPAGAVLQQQQNQGLERGRPPGPPGEHSQYMRSRACSPILAGTLLQLGLLFYADSPNKSRTSQADCIGTYSTGPRKSSVFGNWRTAVCGRGAPAPLPLLHCCTHAAALRGSHVKLCTFKVFIIFPVCTSCPGGAAAGSRRTTGWGGQLGVCKAAPSVFRLPTGAAPAERTIYDTVAIQKIHHEKGLLLVPTPAVQSSTFFSSRHSHCRQSGLKAAPAAQTDARHRCNTSPVLKELT